MDVTDAQPTTEGITRARHLLQRTGFAETPVRIAEAARRPPDALLAERLTSDAPIAPLPPPAWVRERTIAFGTFRDLEPAYRLAATRRLLQIQNDRLAQLQAWWLSSLVATENPLGARMTLFWQNHFTSGQRKVQYTELLYHQQATLMAHASGRFGELLLAVLKDPAMLLYLDQRQSRRGHLNENLARELLELFTLGEGEYAEGDIRELARALTGLSLDREMRFAYRANAHDPGPKTLLGTADVDGAEDVVAVLLEHPATARRLSEKLWRHFVSPEPDPDEIEALAALFRRHDHDVGRLLGALFASEGFADPAARGTLVKSPVEFVVGTHRALGLPPSEPETLVRAVRELQQPLYEPPNVRGWVGGNEWINSATLLARRRFVNGLLRDDALDPAALAALAAGLDGDALVAALLALPPLSGEASGTGATVPRGARAGGEAMDGRAHAPDPIAPLLRDPVYNLV